MEASPSPPKVQRTAADHRRTLAQLSPFFHKQEASASIFTDAKLDDAIFLYTFYLLNFFRPSDHRVRITVNVIGIQDRAAGLALVRHIFASAREVAKAQLGLDSPGLQGLPNISHCILASKNMPPVAPRHEADTYKPYNMGTARSEAGGFPQAADEAETMAFFQEDKQARSAPAADFVAVMAQFFNYELRTGGMNDLIPAEGGVLAFQAGFNTRIPPDLKPEATWQELSAKVQAAGANMVLISNAFSFLPGLKPGTMEATSPFFELLRKQSGLLWGHLTEAGLMESFRFAVDQMSKWLVLAKQDGVDYEKGGVGLKLQDLRRTRLGENFDKSSQKEISDALADLFIKFRSKESGSGGGAEAAGAAGPVLELAKDMFAIVNTALGRGAAEYLSRAVKNLENYGKTVEVTDGHHFAVLFQNVVPCLQPAAPSVQKLVEFQSLDDGAAAECRVWAAREVDVAMSFTWMSELLDVGTAKPLASIARGGRLPGR